MLSADLSWLWWTPPHRHCLQRLGSSWKPHSLTVQDYHNSQCPWGSCAVPSLPDLGQAERCLHHRNDSSVLPSPCLRGADCPTNSQVLCLRVHSGWRECWERAAGWGVVAEASGEECSWWLRLRLRPLAAWWRAEYHDGPQITWATRVLGKTLRGSKVSQLPPRHVCECFLEQGLITSPGPTPEGQARSYQLSSEAWATLTKVHPGSVRLWTTFAAFLSFLKLPGKQAKWECFHSKQSTFWEPSLPLTWTRCTLCWRWVGLQVCLSLAPNQTLGCGLVPLPLCQDFPRPRDAKDICCLCCLPLMWGHSYPEPGKEHPGQQAARAELSCLTNSPSVSSLWTLPSLFCAESPEPSRFLWGARMWLQRDGTPKLATQTEAAMGSISVPLVPNPNIPAALSVS